MQKGTPSSSLTWPSPKPKVQGLHPPFKTCQEGVLSQGTDYTSQFGKARRRDVACELVYPSHELMLILHERKNSHLHPSYLQQD